MIVLDTSGIVAAYNQREAEHTAARDLLTGATEPLIVTPMVLAEVDYLASKYLGAAGARTVLSELDRLATVASFDDEDLRAAIALLTATLVQIGLPGAANVIVTGRHKTTKMFSLDDHYRAVRPQHGVAFELLPAA